MKLQPAACTSFVLLFALAALPEAAWAQSRSSSASVGVGNSDYNDNHLLSLNYASSPAGATVSAGIQDRTFDGLNSADSPSTMTFSASSTGSSEYGLLRVSAAGELFDTFYNPANPPYFDASVDPPVIDVSGVPDWFYAYGQAGFVDNLAYGGLQGGTYNVRYIFRITGHVEGDGFAGGILSFTVSGNPTEYWTIPPSSQGYVLVERGTEAYPVFAQSPHNVNVSFVVWYDVNTQEVPEGSEVLGSFDFGVLYPRGAPEGKQPGGTDATRHFGADHAIVLDHIVVTDENGEEVAGWTVESASGTAYTPSYALSDVFQDGFEDEPVGTSAAGVNAIRCSSSFAIGQAVSLRHALKLCGADALAETIAR